MNELDPVAENEGLLREAARPRQRVHRVRAKPLVAMLGGTSLAVLARRGVESWYGSTCCSRRPDRYPTLFDTPP